MKLLEDITKHKHFILFFAFFIFIVAFILRAYRLTEFIGYHQDQVRDLFYIKDHLNNGLPILLGPKTSVGDFVLPPFWYYLMAFVYFISESPLAPGILIILLSSLTAVLTFIFGKKFFNTTIGVVAALLFTVSPLAVEYGRFAWNPNPVPFFTILTLMALFSYYKTQRPLYFYLAVITANLTLQLNYQGFVLLVILSLFLIIKPFKKITPYFISAAVFLILLLPFFVYEWTHNFENMNGMVDFVTRKSTQGRFMGINNSIKVLFIDYPQYIANALFFGNTWIGRIGFVILHLYLAFKLFMAVKSRSLSTTTVMNLVYASSLLVLFLYRQWIHDYYLLVIVVPLILFFTLFVYDVLPKKYAHLLIALIVAFNIVHSPAFKQPQSMLPFFEAINTKIIESKGTPECIKYTIKTADLKFAPNAVRYLYDSSTKPETTGCTTNFVLCETTLCPQQKTKTVIENDSLDLRFIQLQ